MVEWDIRAAGVILVAALLGAVVTACGGGSTDGDGGPDATHPADAGVDAPPTGGPCDPLAQIGCAPSQKCSLIPGDSPDEPTHPGCVEDTGELGPGAACAPATPTEPDDCRRGLVCRGQDPRCHAFCESNPADTCDEGYICAIDVDLDGDFFVDVQFCAPSCDILEQDCADPDDACYPTRRGTVCATEGAGGTPAGEGQPCPYGNSCAKGMGCFGSGSDFYCYRICDPFDGQPGCATNQTCYRVESEPWGVCA